LGERKCYHQVLFSLVDREALPENRDVDRDITV